MKPEILVIRKFDFFSRILIENDFPVINLPLIKIETSADLSELDGIISDLDTFDGIFFTSPHAAAPFLQKFEKQNKNYRGKFYILGKRTNELFKSAKIETIFSEKIKTAEELINSFPPTEFRGKKFLYARGNLSWRVIPEKLKHSALIREIVVYKTLATKPDEKQSEEIENKLKNNKISAICFFSPSGVDGFLKTFSNFKQGETKIAAIGTTTAGFLKENNLRVDFTAEKPIAEVFAKNLIDYLN